MLEAMKAPEPSRPATLTRSYLLFYNLAMTVGWLVVLLRLLVAAFTRSPIYPAVIGPLKVFQTGAVLEILHALTGLVRAPAATTALQVSSRLMLVWGVCEAVPPVRLHLSFATMVLAWALTEIPRYFYFSVGAVASGVPRWLVVLRYSTFLPLYPMGAGSEWATLRAALPYIWEWGLFSVRMPNRFNFAFDYHLACVAILVLYLPGLPYMYMHMMRQRRKYVSGVDTSSNPAVKTE